MDSLPFGELTVLGFVLGLREAGSPTPVGFPHQRTRHDQILEQAPVRTLPLYRWRNEGSEGQETYPRSWSLQVAEIRAKPRVESKSQVLSDPNPMIKVATWHVVLSLMSMWESHCLPYIILSPRAYITFCFVSVGDYALVMKNWGFLVISPSLQSLAALPIDLQFISVLFGSWLKAPWCLYRWHSKQVLATAKSREPPSPC